MDHTPRKNMRSVFYWIMMTILFMAGLAQGENIYIAQTAQGNDNGTSAANAHSAAWFNTAANWGAGTGKISPGDTARLCGTITTALTVQASGTSGNAITILFEPNAKMTSPAWPTNWWGGGAITIQQKDYITIDGGTNGIIENTDNGTTLGHHQESVGVGGANANYLTVKNLTIRNIYVRTSTAELNSYGSAVQNVCTQAASITGFFVTNCTINDAYIGICSDYGAGCSNYEFSYNTI
jgi:hypothetical protein